MISELWFESGNKSKLTLIRRLLMGGTEGKSEEIPDIVEFTRQRLGFDPNPLQESVLRGGRRGIVNCTRQWGKSTVAAAKAVHRAYCRPDSLILVLSPSERQSGELMRKAEEFVSRLGIKVRATAQTKSRSLFRTGRGLWGCRTTKRRRGDLPKCP